MLPFVEEVAEKGFDQAIRENSALRRGTYTYDGHCLHRSVAEIFGVPLHSVDGN